MLFRSVRGIGKDKTGVVAGPLRLDHPVDGDAAEVQSPHGAVLCRKLHPVQTRGPYENFTYRVLAPAAVLAK